MKRIGVIGSINTDIVISTNTLPNVGETVMGNNFAIMHGGKGANEAVAASRLGASVNLIGCVGDDMFSKNSLANLLHERVHITAVNQIKGKQGGIANIVVSNKNNQIIVIPGANNCCDKKYVKKYCARLKECNIIGAQFEVPLDAVEFAADYAKKQNIKFVLNPSPIKQFSDQLFLNSDYVIVNELEIAYLTGYNKSKPKDVLKLYPNKVILTLGKSGVVYFNGNNFVSVPAIDVNTIDTTGAGDTFLGAFMVAINNEFSLYDSVLFANICAGLKTTKLGAQTAMPTLEEVKKYIKKHKIKLQL